MIPQISGRSQWHYVGVVLSVQKRGILVSRNAAALWGIEANYPRSDNSYLTEVANELLPDALHAAALDTADMVQKLTDVAA